MKNGVDMFMKQRYDTEFLHAEKFAPIMIHQCLKNVYGDMTVIRAQAVGRAFQ